MNWGNGGSRESRGNKTVIEVTEPVEVCNVSTKNK